MSHLDLEAYKDKFTEFGIDGPILMEMKKEVPTASLIAKSLVLQRGGSKS